MNLQQIYLHGRYLLPLLLVLNGCGCAEGVLHMKHELCADGLRMTLEVQSDVRTYTLCVQNISDDPQLFFDNFSEQSKHRWHAGPAQISIRNADGRIISVTPSSPDGWWTSEILSSDVVILPTELRTLQPQEKVAGTFQISDLCGGLNSNGVSASQWLYGKAVRLRVSVWDDSMLSHAHVIETQWFPIQEH